MAKDREAAYAVTINAPRQTVYEFWRDYQNYARYSQDVKSVENLDDNKSRWTAEGPKGEDLTWDIQTIEDVPGEKIGYNSISGNHLNHSGALVFRDAPGDRGTEVTITMTYEQPGGILGEISDKVSGNSPEAQVGETARRFKAILECGEIPTVDGQPSDHMRAQHGKKDTNEKVGMR